jgi:hypothetical protein
MKILTTFLLPFWYVLKYIGQVLAILTIFCIVITHPVLPCLLAADYGNGWLLLYIPIAFCWGIGLKNMYND